MAPQGAPARLGLQALPPLRPRLRLRGRLHGPPRPLPLPQLRQPPPRARAWPPSRSSCAASAPPPSRCARRRARPASSCRCPGSTTSTTRSAPPRCACRWASSCRPSPPGSARSSPPSGAPRRSTSTAARPRSCWSRTRPGANEVLRTLALEGGELDLFGVLNDRIADGRDVSWVWDADWETLAPHVARMTCSGTRAAELALRMKYAGVPVERLHVVEDLATRARPRAGRAAAGPLYALPTYTALLELRGLLSERGAGAGVLAMSAIVLARRRVRRLRRRPAAVARAGRRRGGAGARRRRRRRPRGARARPRRPRRDRARPRRRAARGAAARARSARGSRSAPSRPTPPASSSPARRSALIAVPMQTIQLLPGARPRAAFLASARDAPRAAAASWRSRSPRSSSRSRPTPRIRCRPTPASATAGATAPSRSRSASAATASCSSACAVLTAPDGTTSSEDDAIALATLTAGDLEAEGRAAGLRPEPRALHRRDRRPPRLDGGDAAWLTASCGSARCTRT